MTESLRYENVGDKVLPKYCIARLDFVVRYERGPYKPGVGRAGHLIPIAHRRRASTSKVLSVLIPVRGLACACCANEGEYYSSSSKLEKFQRELIKDMP
jgi:hypothetical protein